MRPPMALADAGAQLLRRLDPEVAHKLTVKLLASGFAPRATQVNEPVLATRVAGIDFVNPLGLAAGFDKNAEAADAMLGLGFGFVEVGAATPRPQPGNDRPRVFRLEEDLAVINRYGFNNDGMAAIAERLRARRARGGVVGVNLGANKDSEDRIADFEAGIAGFADAVDFCTVNISSPNTPGLRALQGRASLDALLARVLAARDALAVRTPVFLKIAPDLTDADKSDIAGAARAFGIDALIVSNTTIARPPELASRFAAEKGGLSGSPLFAPSTALLREFRQALGGAVSLIGVGGVSSARDAYAKILAGADLVQLYTALIFEGPGLPQRILDGLAELLKADGFANVQGAVGRE